MLIDYIGIYDNWISKDILEKSFNITSLIILIICLILAFIFSFFYKYKNADKILSGSLSISLIIILILLNLSLKYENSILIQLNIKSKENFLKNVELVENKTRFLEIDDLKSFQNKILNDFYSKNSSQNEFEKNLFKELVKW